MTGNLKFDIVIIGAGPAGLQCGKQLAASGAKVLIIERKKVIGKKVCAGGITWSGLIERVPKELIERSFSQQTITTSKQNAKLLSPHPILATINRQKLGSFMADEAINSGVEIIFPAVLRSIGENCVTYQKNKKSVKVFFDYLIGADGSLSKVRSHLGLSNTRIGTGINYSLNCTADKMEWNFNSTQFGSGYSWIFPHKETTSIGVYLNHCQHNISKYNKNLLQWAKNNKGFQLNGIRPEAEQICYDYQGWNFGNVFLVGDAAGLASPLTGEGIFPAFISAEAAAGTIIDKKSVPVALNRLIMKHRKHAFMVHLAARNKTSAFILSELAVFLLRFGIISFEKFEMA